jgi:hypothetical protein
MDHVVYTDFRAGELSMLLNGKKRMIIRGAAGRKLPYGRVSEGDRLFFINNNVESYVKAEGIVRNVINSEKMTPSESRSFIESHQDMLLLTDAQLARWGGKRYIVLIEVSDVREIAPFGIDKSGYGNMDDWLPVGNIESVKSGIAGY